MGATKDALIEAMEEAQCERCGSKDQLEGAECAFGCDMWLCIDCRITGGALCNYHEHVMSKD